MQKPFTLWSTATNFNSPLEQKTCCSVRNSMSSCRKVIRVDSFYLPSNLLSNGFGMKTFLYSCRFTAALLVSHSPDHTLPKYAPVPQSWRQSEPEILVGQAEVLWKWAEATCLYIRLFTGSQHQWGKSVPYYNQLSAAVLSCCPV